MFMYHQHRALSSRVLAVQLLHPDGYWTAYIDAVEGLNHRVEAHEVARTGTKLSMTLACVVFPGFDRSLYQG